MEDSVDFRTILFDPGATTKYFALNHVLQSINLKISITLTFM